MMQTYALSTHTVGIVFERRWMRNVAYHLHVDDQIVTATRQRFKPVQPARRPTWLHQILLPFSKSSCNWRWLDGSACSVRIARNDKTELYINGKLRFEIPYYGACKAGDQYIWHEAESRKPALTVESRQQQLAAYEDCFCNNQREMVGRFEGLDQWRLKLGRSSPMPVRDFTGSHDDLLLIWAYLLAHVFRVLTED